MMKFRLIDLSVDGNRVLLLDADARVHVACVPSAGLERGARLRGRCAKLGDHVLVTEGAGVPLHARFESVDCTQHEALTLIHPVGDESPPFASRRGLRAEPAHQYGGTARTACRDPAP